MSGLIKCPMCGKEISPNAVSCPFCGEPMNKDEYCLIIKGLGSRPINVKYRLVKLLDCNIDTVNSIVKDIPYLLFNDLKLEVAEDYKRKLDEVGANISITSKKGYVVSKSNNNNPIMMEERKYSQINNSKDYLKYLEKNHEEKNEDYSITCPNCHSKMVHKISGLSKAGSVAMIGIFAMGKVSKTYQCDKCGYRW